MLSLTLERDFHEGMFPIRIDLKTDAQIIALSGPSGAGKTSILKMIAGLLTPDRGHLSVAGTVLFDSEKRISLPAWQRRIGFVFQDNRLFPHLSVKNNLAYGRFMNGLGHDPFHEAHVITMLDIEKLLARDIGELSGGEQQRVAIGRALLTKPQLLLLDEPMSSLDANRKREIQPYLLRLAAEGVPMIYVSHNADEIAELAGFVVSVEHGIART